MRFNEEEERSGASDGRNAQQEAVARTEEGDRKQGRPGAMGRQGCVYFIETSDGAFVKIGYSMNAPRHAAARRFAAEYLGRTVRLIGVMPGSLETELWLHKKFRHHRHRKEWYKFSPEIRSFIEAVGLIKLTDPDPAVTEMAKALGARGGKARAKNLPAKRRKEIASKAAQARWGEKPNGGKK